MKKREEGCKLRPWQGRKKNCRKKAEGSKTRKLSRSKGQIHFKFFWRVLQAWILHLDILEECIERGGNATVRLLGTAFYTMHILHVAFAYTKDPPQDT